jgi:GAF domain-containing protein
MIRDADYFERVTGGLRAAAELSRRESDPERALVPLTRAAGEVLGDREAGRRLGALKPGERDFVCSGIFFAAPAQDHLILLAEHGFPPEQHRLRIDIGDSRPGHTVRTGEAVVLSNTDRDPMFRQILKTARMGSALYLPMVWQGRVFAMFNVAAQARGTYEETDLRLGLLFADLAAATWIALDGPRFLAELAASLPPWPAS